MPVICRYEPRTPRHEATKLVVLAMVMLAGSIYVSLEFEPMVRRVNWAIVTGVFGGAALLYLFWRGASDQNNTIEPWDMVLDPITRRLSLWRVLLTVTFTVAIWILAQWQLVKVPDNADKIIYLLTLIITSLVAKVMGGEYVDAKANRQPVVAGFDAAPIPPKPPAAPAAPRGADAATEVGQ